MPTVSRRSLLACLAAALLVLVSFSVYAADTTTAPAVTDGTTPVTVITTAPDTTRVPDSSSMMDTPLTTTPDTAITTAPVTTGPDGEDGGFAYWGLVIALIVAGAVIGLIILLVPRNKDK